MKRHERSYDAELNLVPFIDLLSVCITFLLMTAVWIQLARIEMNLQSYSDDSVAAADTPPPDTPSLNLTIFMTDKGYQVSASVGVADLVPKVDGKYNMAKLGEDIAKLKEKFPQETKVIISPENQVLYEDVVAFMDVCLAYGFNDIALSGGVM